MQNCAQSSQIGCLKSCRATLASSGLTAPLASRRPCRHILRVQASTEPATNVQNRRSILLLASWMISGATSGLEAKADVLRRNKEVDPADSQFIQDMLKRTEENRERRYKERLLDYNRRNFREYFSFEAGSLEAARARGINEETYRAIQKWLEENK